MGSICDHRFREQVGIQVKAATVTDRNMRSRHCGMYVNPTLGFHPRDLYLDNGCYAVILVSYNSNILRVIKA